MSRRSRPSLREDGVFFSFRKTLFEWIGLVFLVCVFVLNSTIMMVRITPPTVSLTLPDKTYLSGVRQNTADCDSSNSDAAMAKASMEEQCTLFLAPSSIPDNENRPAGFGIFTTKPLKKGEYVKPQGEGPSIVIPDLMVNQMGGPRPPWSQYIFVGPAIGFNAETQDPNIHTDNSLELFVDLGALTNFHSYLKNVVYEDSDVYKDGLLNRYNDPGAGAFSYHQGNKWYVTRDVKAGEELFNDYDEGWFFDKQMGQAGANMPRKDDFKQAALMLWEMGKSQTDVDLNFVGILHEGFREKGMQRLASLFPKNAPDMIDMMQSIYREKDFAMALAQRTVLHHDIDWIQKHGRCLVHIVPKPSTIPQAGMGAFAVRSLKKGDVVAPAPALLQITDKKTLDMFELNKYQVDGDDPVGKQLLLNYCFGHGKSTMVVCPASSSNLINHCGPKVKGEGQCDNRGPNAVVRWATDFDPETSRWLDMSLDEIDELVKKGRRGLSLEIVALRDIRADEEIFIDYGPEWEEAWKRHLLAWSPPSGNRDNYVSINDMNQNVEKYVKTVEELKTDPYPVDVRVACFVQGFHHPCQILEETPVTEADIPHDSSALNEPRRSVYRVRLEKLEALSRWEIQYRWHFPTKSYETPLSTKYIRFFPGVYSSDQHLPGAFRQQIGVPDDVWPKQWKNL